MTKFLILFAIAVIQAGFVTADPWRDGSAIITCKPNEGYFELLSQQNYYLDFDNEEGEIIGQNVFFPAQLEEHPVVCNLPGHEIVVEGRNKISGKGYCGAKLGAQVRVIVDGKPIAYKFEEVEPAAGSSIGLLSEGWIEISDCYERMHSVNVFSSPELVKVELCRVQNVNYDPRQDLVPLAGTCKIWPWQDPTFNGE